MAAGYGGLMILRRRRTTELPAGHAAHLPSGEQVLAVAPLTDESWAVATALALHLVSDTGVALSSPWHEIDTGVLDGERMVVTITWADRERADTELPLASGDVTRFTTVIRERIQHSVVFSETRRIEGTLVRATIRRDGVGGLYSRLTAFGPLTDSPEVQAEVDDLERHARESAGLPA